MTKEGTKIMSVISVAGHQVVKNLSELFEITLVHLDFHTDYLREKDPNLDSRAVRALLTTGGPRLMRVDGHYHKLKVYLPEGLQTEDLSSSYDHPEITHPDVDFTRAQGTT